MTAFYLYYTDITDAGMKHLPNCPQLHTLDLDGTRITDSGLEHVGQIHGLKFELHNISRSQKFRAAHQALANATISKPRNKPGVF